jgi:CDP-glycerol glycerophosphotransferase
VAAVVRRGRGDGGAGSPDLPRGTGPELLSVVVPVHNEERHVETALRSILGQPHGAVEVIVVDDGSTDGSWDVVSRLAKADGRVRLIQQEHAGPGAARNAGSKAARGEFITFLDSDCVVEPDHYGQAVATLQRTGSDFSVSPYGRFR